MGWRAHLCGIRLAGRLLRICCLSSQSVIGEINLLTIVMRDSDHGPAGPGARVWQSEHLKKIFDSNPQIQKCSATGPLAPVNAALSGRLTETCDLKLNQCGQRGPDRRLDVPGSTLGADVAYDDYLCSRTSSS